MDATRPYGPEKRQVAFVRGPKKVSHRLHEYRKLVHFPPEVIERTEVLEIWSYPSGDDRADQWDFALYDDGMRLIAHARVYPGRRRLR